MFKDEVELGAMQDDACQCDFGEILDAARGLLGSCDCNPQTLWDANALVNQALRIATDRHEPWLLKSQIMSALDDQSGSLAAAEMAVRHAPHCTEAHYWRAVALA